MPAQYPACVDCGQPKTTHSQRLSQRCNVCAGIKKRTEKGEYYTHCVDCGVEKPLGTSRRSPRCRACAYSKLRHNEFFGVCQKCGVSKKCTKNKLCHSCAGKQRWDGKRIKTYPICQECGEEKANTTRELCHSCSTRQTWDTSRERIRALYDICQECGQEKARNDRELCPSCAGIRRMIELFGTEDKEYPMGWCDALKERIRDRDSRKCQLCGKAEKENGRKLDVHHIDEDKHNLAYSNLIALCTRCHGKTRWQQDFYYQVFTKYRGRALKHGWQGKVVVSAERGLSLAV